MRAPATLRLLRPLNGALAAVAVWGGALLAGIPPSLVSPYVLGGALSAFFFAGAGNVRNDVMDVGLDRAAHPTRPLVTGEVRVGTARALVVLLYALSVASAAWVGLTALVLVVVAIVLMESYERALKARGLPGNLVVAALTGAPFLMGLLAAEGAGWSGWSFPLLDHPGLAALAFLAVLANLAREVLKDVEDVEADRGRRVTLPMRLGARRAAWLAGALLVVAALLSPLPWRLESVMAWPYLPAVGLADACFVAAAAAGAGWPARAQRLAKAGMALAILAIFAGAFLG